MSGNGNGLLDTNTLQRYRAINDLVEDSREDGSYYTLLILSSVIISAGILLASPSILIGGMLVTPVLTPILLIALGIATSKPQLIRDVSFLILKSVVVIVGISFIASLIFGIPNDETFFQSSIFNNSIRAAFLYFLVAFASGLAATFAWVRKEVTNILPGISIAVSLVPPIAMTGIWLAAFNGEMFRFFLMVFLFNLFGIVMGGLIVFSLMQFHKSGPTVTTTLNKVKDNSHINNGENAQ